MSDVSRNPTCPFCDPTLLAERMICEWDDAYVVSDANPIVFGHVLVVAKRHALSFGAMDPGTLSRLRNNILRFTSAVLRDIGSRVILFERGNSSENVSGVPSVDHAHFHLIPTRDLSSLLPKTKRGGCFSELPAYLASGSYYFYWDIESNSAFWGESSKIESQFIRRTVAHVEGVAVWNWKIAPSPRCASREQSTRIRNMMRAPD